MRARPDNSILPYFQSIQESPEVAPVHVPTNMTSILPMNTLVSGNIDLTRPDRIIPQMSIFPRSVPLGVDEQTTCNHKPGLTLLLGLIIGGCVGFIAGGILAMDTRQ